MLFLISHFGTQKERERERERERDRERESERERERERRAVSSGSNKDKRTAYAATVQGMTIFHPGSELALTVKMLS